MSIIEQRNRLSVLFGVLCVSVCLLMTAEAWAQSTAQAAIGATQEILLKGNQVALFVLLVIVFMVGLIWLTWMNNRTVANLGKQHDKAVSELAEAIRQQSDGIAASNLTHATSVHNMLERLDRNPCLASEALRKMALRQLSGSGGAT